MPRIKYSEAARSDLIRLHQFLAQYDEAVGVRAIEAILKSVNALDVHPTSGSPVPDRPNVRKLVVDFGATGYLVFHKRYEKTDTNFIARIIHQKEWYDDATVGLVEEVLEDPNTGKQKTRPPTAKERQRASLTVL